MYIVCVLLFLDIFDKNAHKCLFFFNGAEKTNERERPKKMKKRCVGTRAEEREKISFEKKIFLRSLQERPKNRKNFLLIIAHGKVSPTPTQYNKNGFRFTNQRRF
jgi:hypothetical protein